MSHLLSHLRMLPRDKFSSTYNDGDVQDDGDALKTLLNVTSKIQGTAFHPQTQGLAERVSGQMKNRVLKKGQESGLGHTHTAHVKPSPK